MISQVYTFWNQPIPRAPLAVRLGVESWRRACKNEGIKYTLVSAQNCCDVEAELPENFSDKLQFVRSQIEQNESYHSWRTYSNILRLALVTHRGGLWADPTTVCNKPISTWTQTLPYGFKFPRFEGIHQTSENWLLVAEKENDVCRAWFSHLSNYYVNHPNLNLHGSGVNQSLWSKIVVKLTHLHPKFGWLWFHWVTTKTLRITNYFTAYFSFEVVRRHSFPNHAIHYFHLDLDSSMYRTFITTDWKNFDTHWCRNRVLSMPVIKLSWKRCNTSRLADLPEPHAFRVIAERLGISDADLET